MKAQVSDSRKIKNVVITRSRKGNLELAGRLRAMGVQSLSIDTIEFLPPEDWSAIDAALVRLNEFDWLLFTSATGVEYFAQRMTALSLAIPWLGRPAVAAVGETTSAALQKRGVEVKFVPSRYLAKSLGVELPRGLGRSILMLRADIGDPDVQPTLERDGFNVQDLTIYRTSPVAGGTRDVTEERLRGADAIVFASPSAVEGFFGRLDSAATGSDLAKKLLAVCIGPVTAKAAKERGFERILTPKTQTIQSLLDSLRGLFPAGEGE